MTRLGERVRQVHRRVSQWFGIPDLDVRGQRVTDDSFVLCFNAHHEPIEFVLPPEEFGSRWESVIYTADAVHVEGVKPIDAGESLSVEGRSILVLRGLVSTA